MLHLQYAAARRVGSRAVAELAGRKRLEPRPAHVAGFILASAQPAQISAPSNIRSEPTVPDNSPAKPPAMPERIEAVLQLREWGRRITTIFGEPRGPQGDRNVIGS
jgi:hypothetical protein